MAEKEDRDRATGLIVGGIGGAALATAIAAIIAARPAAAAPPEEKLDYLIEVLTALVPVLAESSERQATLIQLFEQWLAAQGVPGIPGIEVVVRAPWVAKEPEEIFSKAIRDADTFYSDRMVDWRQGKRIYLFVESTLDQDVQIQVIGNKTDNEKDATDIGSVHTCPAHDNISLAPAWEQWCPYIGIKIVASIAPGSGRLTISEVRQE